MKHNVTPHLLNIGVYLAYRETAVLEAFSAAGVKHAISRGCAAGHLKKCHCAEAGNMVETRQTWKWGGCGDNLSYGHSFTTKFLGGGPMKSIRKVKKVSRSTQKYTICNPFTRVSVVSQSHFNKLA